MRSEPARPLPAATLVPLRDGDAGLEVLLLLRSERSSFAPGRYVFPGGVVDDADASSESTALMSGVAEARAPAWLGMSGAYSPTAYLVAAVRETFEESGLLVAVRDAVGRVPFHADPDVVDLRAQMLEGRIGFSEALGRLGARIASEELIYFAHWITPELSPRRYDTRFFAARVDTSRTGPPPAVDGREMRQALWTTPSAALQALEAGSMKMILPTIETLRRLAAFPDVGSALSALGKAVVATNLPVADPRLDET